MPRLPVWLGVGLCGVLGACATTPDVTVGYYLPKATTAVQVVETLGCNAAKSKVFALQTVTPTTTYAADPSRRYEIPLQSLDRWYADSDTTITLTTDRRLAGINSSGTGAGEALVKAGVTTAEAILPILGLGAAAAPEKGFVKASPEPACDAIAAASKEKPATLTYNLARPIDWTADFGKDFDLQADPPSAALVEQLKSVAPKLKLHVGRPPPKLERTAVYKAGRNDDVVLLKVVDTAAVPLTVTAAQPRDATQVETIYAQPVLVPLSTDYDLPIPRGAFFGKRSINLAVDGSGALTTVAYGATSGSTGAATAVGDVATPFAPKTAGQKAADLKDQADVIAQQQRLMTCQATPSACPD